jgi:hypothetical protein
VNLSYAFAADAINVDVVLLVIGAMKSLRQLLCEHDQLIDQLGESSSSR